MARHARRSLALLVLAGLALMLTAGAGARTRAEGVARGRSIVFGPDYSFRPLGHHRIALSVSLPTWENHYDWAGGDGYVGWQTGGNAPANLWGLQPALGGDQNFGLWIWPVGSGGKDYAPSYVEWTYTAPGTTRLANAELDLAYRNKLLAHHCLTLGLRLDDGTATDSNVNCKPVRPPNSQNEFHVSLNDPSSEPTSKTLYFRVEMPPCDKNNPDACPKHIPSKDPLNNGAYARLKHVDMILVDDDKPVVQPSGVFRDELTYINGTESFPLHLDTYDAGAGIVRAWVEEVGTGVLSSTDAPCDPQHHTPDLDTRICPQAFSYDSSVPTSSLPEGQAEFVAKAVDPAGNVGESEHWFVYVDRTPPAPPTNASVDNYDAATGTATVTWDAGDDPDLTDGSVGSGVTSYAYRVAVNDGSFGDWVTRDDPSFDVAAAPGDTLHVEFTDTDAVGNRSDVGSATLTVTGAEQAFDEGPVEEGDDDPNAEPVPPDPPDPGDVQALRRAATPAVTWKIRTDTTHGLGWHFTNNDGTWTIWGKCYDSGVIEQNGGERVGVGPGYIARFVTAGGTTLVQDERYRFRSNTDIDSPNAGSGYTGAMNGGLGSFEVHFSHGVARHSPAGVDPTKLSPYTKPTDPYDPADDTATADEKSRRSESRPAGVPNNDARDHPFLNTRMCAADNGGYGVKAGTIARRGPTRDKAGDVHFTAIVTFVADSSPFLRVSYHYVFRPSEVRAYMAVAVLSDGNASETYFVKEPKFAAILRGGTYTHESLYLGRSTTPVRLVGQPTQTYIGMAHKQVEKRDAQNHYPTLFTLQGQTSYVGRTRVSWNHGPDNDAPSCATCFNVVMRSYKANSSTQDVARIGQPTQPWQPTSRSCSETLGLDKWACLAAGQDPAYPMDTRAGTGDNTAWRCGTDNLVDKNGDKKIDDRDAALISRNVTPRRVSLRQWELLGGWTKDATPSEQSTFSASGVLFHGWEGGRGPHDCEQLERALSVGDTFAVFASYSYGPGWSLG